MLWKIGQALSDRPIRDCAVHGVRLPCPTERAESRSDIDRAAQDRLCKGGLEDLLFGLNLRVFKKSIAIARYG